METHTIADRETWLAARAALLVEEKALTRQRDALAAKRRALPWVKVEKAYAFDTADGPKTLSELFAGKRQLMVYHFMFGPDWETGCKGCSFLSDHLNGIIPHLEQRDIAFVAVSRAPLGKLDAFKRRMGWSFRWVSSGGSDFNFDFGVSFTDAQQADRATYNFREITPPMSDLPGTSVFIKGADGQIFHTYSQFARGGEDVLAAYALIDMTPLGRQERGPDGGMQQWLKLRDEYETAPAPMESQPCPACA